MLGCWLLEERQRLCRYLRLLQLIGVLAPMLGLLGTVLGMVAMFADIAAVDQPVTPALLADGLWQALYTTIWGLFIAIRHWPRGGLCPVGRALPGGCRPCSTAATWPWKGWS